MTRLQVEVADFRDAASTLRHNVAESVRISMDGLQGRLQPELVGDDPAGSAWAAAYEPAATSVLRATAQLINAAGRTSLLLAHSGRNYARAEAAANPHHDGREQDFADLLQPLPTAHAPSCPPAGGVGHGTPSGWWIIEHSIGVVWPGGHQDRLRATAHAWNAAAGGIDNIAFEPVLAAVSFARDRLPEADDILTVCRSLNTRLEHLGRAYRSLATACSEYADHLDECHAAVRDELSDLVRDSAITQGAGAVLAVVSLGASEAAAQTAQVSRIGIAVTRITMLIERFAAAARRLVTLIRRAQHLAEEIREAMTALTSAEVAEAATTNARRTPKLSRSNERTRGAGKIAHVSEPDDVSAALARLARETRIRRPVNQTERRHILDGDENGGGHRYPGKIGKDGKRKSAFPAEWSDEQIIANVQDIIDSNRTSWFAATGNGGILTKKGNPARWRAWEVRDGIRIRVVWEPANGRVVTAFPDRSDPEGVPVP